MRPCVVLAAFMLAVYASKPMASCIDTLQAETPSRDFIVEDDLVTHKETGLMWARCSLGYNWNAHLATCEYDRIANEVQFTWLNAISHAAKSRLGGKSDWRLPNKNELMSIADHGCTGPAINEAIFPNTAADSYWTSSPYGNELENVWRVVFTTGDLLNAPVSTKLFVRLVREP